MTLPRWLRTLRLDSADGPPWMCPRRLSARFLVAVLLVRYNPFVATICPMPLGLLTDLACASIGFGVGLVVALFSRTLALLSGLFAISLHVRPGCPAHLRRV